VICIDIGKNSFHVVGHDACGAIVLRQKWSRGQVDARLANLQNNLSSQLGDVFRGPAAGTTSAPDLASIGTRHSCLVIARRPGDCRPISRPRNRGSGLSIRIAVWWREIACAGEGELRWRSVANQLDRK
jgi:hypothetical protein